MDDATDGVRVIETKHSGVSYRPERPSDVAEEVLRTVTQLLFYELVLKILE